MARPNKSRLPFEAPIVEMEARLAELEARYADARAGQDQGVADIAEQQVEIQQMAAWLKQHPVASQSSGK